eukprot:SAG11_NODE_3206_length_2611_cov_1.542596_3_plen_142_part_00
MWTRSSKQSGCHEESGSETICGGEGREKKGCLQAAPTEFARRFQKCLLTDVPISLFLRLRHHILFSILFVTSLQPFRAVRDHKIDSQESSLGSKPDCNEGKFSSTPTSSDTLSGVPRRECLPLRSMFSAPSADALKGVPAA